MTNPTNFLTLVLEGALLNCGPMADLTADEIASTLLARVIREIQNFAVSATIHEGASAEQTWSHFVDYLTNERQLKGR